MKNSNFPCNHIFLFFFLWITLLLYPVITFSSDDVRISEKPVADLVLPEIPMQTVINEKTVVLTLREAILIALRYNPILENSEIQRVVDKFALRVNFWNYELHYSLLGNATYNYTVSSNVKTESDTQTITPGVSLLTPVGTKLALDMVNPLTHTSGMARLYNPSLRLTLAQPLLKGSGSDVVLAPLRQAENTEDLNRLNLKNTVMQTITSVIQQYASVAQAENSLEVQRLSVVNSITTLKQQEALLKAGRVALADLVQFQATVASQQLSFQQQQVSLAQQKLALLTILGIDPTSQITTTKKARFDDDILPTLEECISMALQNNIPYQQGLIALKQVKLGLLKAEDDQRWQLDLTASRTQGGGSGHAPNTGLSSLFNGANYNTTVGLSLSVPINDLSLQKSLVDAKAALRQQYVNLAALKRQTVNNVINAYNTVLNQKQQITQAKVAMDLAQQTLNVSLAKLKYGRVTPFEVSTQQTNLTSQQISYINAITAYVTNLAQLDQIIGYTLDRWKVKVRY